MGLLPSAILVVAAGLLAFLLAVAISSVLRRVGRRTGRARSQAAPTRVRLAARAPEEEFEEPGFSVSGTSQGLVTAASFRALLASAQRETGILRVLKDRELTPRRNLVSLLANVRDRDILHEKGYRIGKGIHPASHEDLGQKLFSGKVATEVEFRRVDAATLDVTLVGTALAREAPRIGLAVCYMEAGLLEGALENLEHAPGRDDARVHVVETRCVVRGDPACVFRASAKGVDAA